ncbi:hypothetical protein D3C85_1585250 [compost metagenome]
MDLIQHMAESGAAQPFGYIDGEALQTNIPLLQLLQIHIQSTVLLKINMVIELHFA